MTAFEFGPADKAGPAPTPDEVIRFISDQLERTWACEARPGGHRWKVEAEPGGKPGLSCEDCPASADDLVGDSCIYLEEEPYDIGGRTVDFSRRLADDAEPYSIPVRISVEVVRHMTIPHDLDGDDPEVFLEEHEIHITPREVAS